MKIRSSLDKESHIRFISQEVNCSEL